MPLFLRRKEAILMQGVRLYDETNKKFILSKYVIFFESSKNDKIIERQLDHLDRLTRVNTYHEFDGEIPHLEGGIPTLGQSMESPFSFETPSPPHEEVLATLSEPEVHLDDAIERTKNLNLNDNLAPCQ
jgi:hypothetical protein